MFIQIFRPAFYPSFSEQRSFFWCFSGEKYQVLVFQDVHGAVPRFSLFCEEQDLYGKDGYLLIFQDDVGIRNVLWSQRWYMRKMPRCAMTPFSVARIYHPSHPGQKICRISISRYVFLIFYGNQNKSHDRLNIVFSCIFIHPTSKTSKNTWQLFSLKLVEVETVPGIVSLWVGRLRRFVLKTGRSNIFQMLFGTTSQVPPKDIIYNIYI